MCTSVGTVGDVDPNVFETANAGFAQAMYEEFLRDPAAVGPEWRRLFESGVIGEKPSSNGSDRRAEGQGALAVEPAPRRLGPSHRLSAARLCGGPAARRRPHQGTPGQARRQHDREPHGPDRDDASGWSRSGYWRSGAAGSTQGLQAAGQIRQGLVHPPHRLRARPSHQAASGHGAHAPHTGRHPPPSAARGNRARARGGRAAEGRKPRAGGAGDQARRDDGLRRLPRGLRGAGREGAHQPPDARRLRRRHHVAHQPGRPRHGRLGAAADGRSGQHHRRRGDRLSGGVLRRAGGAAPRVRRQQGHDGHQHVRPPRHPGRGIGSVPGDARSPAAGRRRASTSSWKRASSCRRSATSW